MRITRRAIWGLHGPACPLVIETDPQPIVVSAMTPTLALRRQTPALVVDDDEVVTTTLPTTGLIPTSDPLWPRTESGLRLREAYLRHGERALVEMPDHLARHWCDTDDDVWP